jgi:hypothetical protein
LTTDAPLGRSMALRMRVFGSTLPLRSERQTQKGGAKMELNSFLGSDAALLLFSGLGLVATGLAIVRDIPVQRRVVDRPVQIEN